MGRPSSGREPRTLRSRRLPSRGAAVDRPEHDGGIVECGPDGPGPGHVFGLAVVEENAAEVARLLRAPPSDPGMPSEAEPTEGADRPMSPGGGLNGRFVYRLVTTATSP
ncbi:MULTISPECIES: hypothetical protein [unclassified Arthrobacter]|uniref:hypothetical protein n=1 Tax=unclassified Arthrobacter TaxID=235627 RepID=UPI003394378D